MNDRLNSEIDRIRKLLECPICLEKYANPKILPCSHTFCLRCIIPVNRKITCPMCRMEIIVPNAGTIGLTSNRQISDLLEIDLINTDINILNNLSNQEEGRRIMSAQRFRSAASNRTISTISEVYVNNLRSSQLPFGNSSSISLLQTNLLRPPTQPEQLTVSQRSIIIPVTSRDSVNSSEQFEEPQELIKCKIGCSQPISIYYIILIYIIITLISLVILIINEILNN